MSCAKRVEDEFAAHARMAIKTMLETLKDNPDYNLYHNDGTSEGLRSCDRGGEQKGAKGYELNPPVKIFPIPP